MESTRTWIHVLGAGLLAVGLACCGDDRRPEPGDRSEEPHARETEPDESDEAQPPPEQAEPDEAQPTPEQAEPDGAPTEPESTTGALPEPELLEADGLRLVELVMARGVEDREPQGKTRSFELGRQSRAYVWMRLQNLEQRETEVILEWVLPDGSVRPGAKLRVPASPRYVTWAYRGLPLAGRWGAQIKSADGSRLGRVEFEVTSDAPTTLEPEPATSAAEPTAPAEPGSVTPAAGTAAAASGLRIKAMVVCRAVEDRQPVGAGTSFSRAEGGRLFTHVLLENPGARATKINLTWQRPDGVVLQGVHLDVPSRPSYVTWAVRGMPPQTGSWVALARSPEGTVLARQEIEVVE